MTNKLSIQVSIGLVYILPLWGILFTSTMALYLASFILASLAINAIFTRKIHISFAYFAYFLYIAISFNMSYFYNIGHFIRSVVLIIAPFILVSSCCVTHSNQIRLLKHFCYSAALQFIYFILNLNIFLSIPIIDRLFVRTSEITLMAGGRNGGSIGDYELVAEFLTMGLVATISLLLHAVNIRSNTKKLLISTTAILIAGFMTITRSFILVGGLGTLMSLFAISKNKLTKLKYSFLLLVLIFISVTLLPSDLLNRNKERINMIEVTGENAFNRRGLYQTGIEMLPNAGLLGFGSNFSNTFSPNSATTSTHSLYLDTLLITGYLGGLFLLIMLLRSITYISTYFRSSNKMTYQKSIVFVISSILIVIWFVNELKINATRQYSYFSMIGMIFALHAASFATSKQKNSVKKFQVK